MKIAVWSNAPHAPTGYGTQTAQLTKRLKADGHEVAVLANYGVNVAPQVVDGILTFPTGLHPYSLDNADYWADYYFEGERGLIVVLYDTWPLTEAPELFAKHDAWYWCPIDHTPPPPKVQEWCAKHNVIAMSEFGREQLTRVGLPPAYTIPHGIDTTVFRPTPSDLRQIMQVPEDAHLTTTVMANIGTIPFPRKMWFENLMGWRIFAQKHDDAYIYIHTQLRHPRGIDLPVFMRMWGLPEERVRIADQGTYAGGLITQEQLAAIYTASNVTLMATAGEGFGIPAVESQASGTPVIATDFSAQQEVAGVGWRVPYTTFWDYGQGAVQAMPDVASIANALEQSYEHTPEMRADVAAKAIAFAAKYDADKVYAEHWRPFLADREAKPNRQQRRQKRKLSVVK